jgi:hypothetical protein
LGEVAERIELDRTHLDPDRKVVAITDETVSELGRHGRLTTASPPSAVPSPTVVSPTPASAAAGRRSYWRKRVLAQAQRVEKCRAGLERLDAAIDALEDAAFDRGSKGARDWARAGEMKRRREIAESECVREQAELSRLVRAARKEGAQPGWFR